ncbi:unnamed protein product [Paramecium pentaurelia]|uniref:Transmembrane protein n=1 Tax=Paramecium pentaurelia TaxID=43138 RepID=A0A8S1VNB4_9CILI|nr:unnamed protein product [Paramecium pentaurelia]
MNMYSYEAYKTDNQNDQKVFDVNNQNKLELEQSKSISTTQKRADFESSVFSALVIQNLFILMMICFGLFTNMQFWLVDQPSDIIDFCYCGFGNTYQCQDECVYSQDEQNYPKPIALFYCSLIIGLIMHIWLNVGLAQIQKQHFLIILLYLAILCLFYIFTLTTFSILIAYTLGVQLIFLSWIIDFVFIFCIAFYTTRTKTQVNYKVGTIFIFIPTLLFLIIYISIYPDSALYICLDCFIVAIHEYFIIAEIIRFRNKEEFTSSILDIMIGSSLLFGSINQCVISLIELCQGFLKKSI